MQIDWCDMNTAEIEKKWQTYWVGNKTFKTHDDYSKPKLYVLDMFPYPSGAGLHVGHPEGYTATDIFCRYKRMKGINVLHPMGWDAFGLPAEQYAIKTGTHPAVTTQNNCDNFRRQIQALGFSYDWDREINTTDEKYYKWTQWIFIQLYNTWFDDAQQKGRPISELPIPEDITAQGKEAIRDYIDSKRLAFFAEANVWFCDTCKTVCANEEVLMDGTHEKCNTKSVRKLPLKQWQLRISLYAERLLKGLDSLDWPEGIKQMQRNWIGKSRGAELNFEVAGHNTHFTVYTTRPDTLYGATYTVLAPEHPLVQQITTPDRKAEVDAYIARCATMSDLQRTELNKDKTGAFTGAYAINPVNGDKLPIWISDYVMMGYGTGAIMAVPAHDTRDFEFASKFNIPIICIMEPDRKAAEEAGVSVDDILAGKACWTENGNLINSEGNGLSLNGLDKNEAIEKMIAWLEERHIGTGASKYKLRDWIFSRQRYWGEPFPIIHWEDGEVSVLNTEELPLTLPNLEKIEPSSTGESPLANATTWLEVIDPVTGRKGRRETNTMPQWAGSCWYYLRYIDAHNDLMAWDPQKEKYWMPVDLYVGGAEHAVLHLLYSRFWHKVLFDLGYVSTEEPFQKLFNQGLILAFAYRDAIGSLVPNDEVIEEDGKYYAKDDHRELTKIVAKMSKSLKNVVNPDDVINQYGADSLRLYEMFMGPLDAAKPWQTDAVEGIYRFINRAWRMIVGNEITDEPLSKEQNRLLHQTIKKVGEDIENFSFNTAISQMMIFLNEFAKPGKKNRQAMEYFVLCLAPFAPHVAEELWEKLGHTETLAYEPFPTFDPQALVLDEVEILVQICGKPAARIMAPGSADAETLGQFAIQHEQIKDRLAGKNIVKIIAVPGRLVNIVAK